MRTNILLPATSIINFTLCGGITISFYTISVAQILFALQWFRFSIVTEIFSIWTNVRPTILTITFIIATTAIATIGATTNICSSVPIAIIVVVITMIAACVIVIVNRTITSI